MTEKKRTPSRVTLHMKAIRAKLEAEQKIVTLNERYEKFKIDWYAKKEVAVSALNTASARLAEFEKGSEGGE